MAQTYQTLQDPSLPPVTIPYRRLPQLSVTANRGDLPSASRSALPAKMSISAIRRVQGPAATLYPQLSLPLCEQVLSISPKIGFSLDAVWQNQAAGTPDKLTATLIFGVRFRRHHLRTPVNRFRCGSDATNLEPRVFCTFTLPVPH